MKTVSYRRPISPIMKLPGAAYFVTSMNSGTSRMERDWCGVNERHVGVAQPWDVLQKRGFQRHPDGGCTQLEVTREVILVVSRPEGATWRYQPAGFEMVVRS